MLSTAVVAMILLTVAVLVNSFWQKAALTKAALAAARPLLSSPTDLGSYTIEGTYQGTNLEYVLEAHADRTPLYSTLVRGKTSQRAALSICPKRAPKQWVHLKHPVEQSRFSEMFDVTGPQKGAGWLDEELKDAILDQYPVEVDISDGIVHVRKPGWSSAEKDARALLSLGAHVVHGLEKTSPMDRYPGNMETSEETVALPRKANEKELGQTIQAKIHTRYLRVARTLGWSAYGCLILFVAGITGLSLAPMHTEMMVAALVTTFSPLLAITLGIGALVVRAALPRGSTTIKVEDKGILIQRGKSEKRIGPLDIRSGWLERGDHGYQVALELRGGNVWCAEMTTVSEARAVLRAAGGDEARSAFNLRVGDTTFWDLLGLVGSGVTASVLAILVQNRWLPTGVIPVLWLVIVSAAYFFMHRSIWVDLRVGVDGISFTHRWRTQFVPFDKIDSVGLDPRGIALELNEGNCVSIPIRHLSEQQRQILFTRVDAAYALSRERKQGDTALQFLERQGRTLEQWQRGVSQLLCESYRGVSLTKDAILRILSDPSAPAERRVGAALALNQLSDPEAKKHIRIAAETSANERVRVVLQMVADETLDDSAVEELAQRADC